MSTCSNTLTRSHARWCRSLWSIGGDNLQFYPNFAIFSTLRGMNFDHNFVQVWKFSEEQKKKANGTLKFPKFPQIQVKTKKKKVFYKNRTLFSPNLRSDVHPFKLLGGDTAKLLGGYIPPSPPCFATPAHACLTAN